MNDHFGNIMTCICPIQILFFWGRSSSGSILSATWSIEAQVVSKLALFGCWHNRIFSAFVSQSELFEETQFLIYQNQINSRYLNFIQLIVKDTNFEDF